MSGLKMIACVMLLVLEIEGAGQLYSWLFSGGVFRKSNQVYFFPFTSAELIKASIIFNFFYNSSLFASDLQNFSF